MFQDIMICVEDEFLVEKIMHPVLNSLNNSIKLNVVCTVTSTGTCNFRAEKGDWTTLLAKDRADP